MQSPPTSAGLTVQAKSTINAPLERVWSVLVDFPRYGEWNTFVPIVQTTSQIGSALNMHVQMRKGLRVKFTTTITALERPSSLAWKTRLPSWLLASERFQTITPIDANTTCYETSETFTGLLASLLKLLLNKDLQRGFTSVAQNLKIRAESLSD